MHPVDLTCFAITLFLALAGLINWKYRKDDVKARLNRTLKGYVQTSCEERAAGKQEANDEDPIVA
jgi:hypothetical protein